MIIRDARPSDHDGIRALLLAAFPTDDEARLVEQLRADGDAAFEWVAEDGGRILGEILLSPLAAPFRALALAPVAVAPERQGSGIGSALVEAAVGQARDRGWEAIFVLGEPAYYTRFGFAVAAAAGFTSPYSGPYFMVLALSGALACTSGEVRYAPAFAALG